MATYWLEMAFTYSDISKGNISLLQGRSVNKVCVTYRVIYTYRRIFHDVTLPRQCKNWSMMAVQGTIPGDHFYYKRERNIVLQLE